MSTIYNLRLFVITLIAMMATTVSAQDSLPIALPYPAEGATRSIDIAETTVSWKLTCDAPWISITPSEGTGAAKVDIIADTNESGQEREAVILIDTGIGDPTKLFLAKQKAKVDASVTTVNADTSTRSTVVTTLSGTKVKAGSQRRGIYIVNGKKVIRKKNCG